VTGRFGQIGPQLSLPVFVAVLGNRYRSTGEYQVGFFFFVLTLVIGAVVDVRALPRLTPHIHLIQVSK
jgi:hypothetical protein